MEELNNQKREEEEYLRYIDNIVEKKFPTPKSTIAIKYSADKIKVYIIYLERFKGKT